MRLTQRGVLLKMAALDNCISCSEFRKNIFAAIPAMKEIYLLFALLLFAGRSFGQDTSTFYFDEFWEPANEQQAAYYRKVYWNAGVWHVRDFYNNGILQMKGQYSVMRL